MWVAINEISRESMTCQPAFGSMPVLKNDQPVSSWFAKESTCCTVSPSGMLHFYSPTNALDQMLVVLSALHSANV